MVASLLCALPPPWGRGATALYIDTEGKFSAERAGQMLASRVPRGGPAPQEVLARVLVQRVHSTTELLGVLGRLEEVISQHGVRLVVVDSVAALARVEFGRDNLQQRQEALGQQAARLKYLAERLHCAVVVTNQVTTRIDEDSGVSGNVAALGVGCCALASIAYTGRIEYLCASCCR